MRNRSHIRLLRILSVIQFMVMRHAIAVCFLFLACTLAHAQGTPDPCAIPPSGEWEVLSAPPPESEHMPGMTLHPPQGAWKPDQKDVWFHAKSGAFRLCRHYGPTDLCYWMSEYTDFHLSHGHWIIASLGSTSRCAGTPQKCGPAALRENSGDQADATDVDKAKAPLVALRTIAERLSTEWSPPSRDVYLAISVQRRDGKDFLHFCIENTSMHSLDLNDSALPWNAPNLLRLTVLNSKGTVVFSSGPVFIQPMSAPVQHTINASDSVEGDLELSIYRFYEAAAKEDLLVMWSGRIELYAERNPGGIQLPVSGIVFLPKH
jgi:hypothetical protein